MLRDERRPNSLVPRHWVRPILALMALLSVFALPRLGRAATPSNIVILIGEDEYKTWETLPEFAKTELEPRGMKITVIQQDPKDINNFPGLIEALPKADLLLLSTRRRLSAKEQIDAIRSFLNSGKPLVGIRTACHALRRPWRARRTRPSRGPMDAAGPILIRKYSGAITRTIGHPERKSQFPSLPAREARRF